MMQIARRGGKYYIYSYSEIKDFENIEKYFDIKPEETGKIKLF